MIAYVIPTRNRAEELSRTLDALGGLAPHDAELIVVDNASGVPPALPLRLANDIPVRAILLSRNDAAAARNIAVQSTDRPWIVMLDDDSHPLSIGHVQALARQPHDVAAVQAEIWLSPPGGGASPRRESGGLPEVFIGCGVAIRRDAFLAAGGYDASFHYYAEEYDLAAKLLMRQHRVVMDRRFQVHHRKAVNQRSMDRILARLVRNNAWVMQRYAPDPARASEVRRTITRYGAIALKERAEIGYARGLAGLAFSLHRQRRTPMDQDLWDRFTGKAACREALGAAMQRIRFRTATLIESGKNRHIIEEVLVELGARIADARADAEAVVIGTLSPGPMLDAYDLLASAAGDWLICPWNAPSAISGSDGVLTTSRVAA